MLLECCSILENLENLPRLARNGTRALAQAMYDSMYHQPGIGGPDSLSRLHLRAQCTQSQIDHTRTVRLVRLRIVRITAQGRDWCLVLGLLVFIWWSDRDFPNPQFAESFSNNKIANWGWVLGPFGLYMVVSQRFFTPSRFGLYLVVSQRFFTPPSFGLYLVV